ncbi:MAG TPA: hypothetical protein VJS43_02950 [Candidatus Acidoferrales bacterium]|nr:hypothetical protein [Candidatus Acidoferrales bacterium]
MVPLIERRIRWAGLLIVCGLVIQMITLIFVHPLAFMAFLLISCPLVAIGILLFLYSIVSHDHSKSESAQLGKSATAPETRA